MRIVVLIVIITLAHSFSLSGQNKGKKKYEYTVDLTNVVDDRLYIELTPPLITEDEITFFMPKVIPGTYAIADYGRFVKDLNAYDKRGKKLEVEKLNDNAWKIKKAKKLAKISYWIDDSFDSEIKGPEIFWPAGTSIEKDKSFIINTAGFFGYLEGQKEKPFQVNILRSPDFYGSTGLVPSQSGVPAKIIKMEKNVSSGGKVMDVFSTADYDELIDSPLMYSKPDTAIIRVANAEVLIGSYSPSNKVTAKQIAASIKEVLTAQAKFLGNKLPVDKYAFIFYFTQEQLMSYGALEHSYSSFYYMPEMTIEDMNQQLRDFAAHEFFHIVTPLTIHSEQIENFDFNAPEMSKHLWMYEGVTEYFASNVQVKYGLISPEDFLQVIKEKIFTADQFIDDVPFTEISKNTLDKYHDQFYNVYQKGALIALCLDIKLLKLSKGKYGLRNLMLELSEKYGKSKSFKDDELFDEITRMTFPEIREFFTRYVEGAEPLPLEEIFAEVGIEYAEEEKYQDYSLGLSTSDLGIAQVDGKPKLQIASTEKQNEMGKALGLKQGDLILKMNDELLPDIGPELGVFLQKHYKNLPTSKTLTYTVLRQDENGQSSEVVLSAPVMKVEVVKRHLMQYDEAAAQEKVALRDAWLKP